MIMTSPVNKLINKNLCFGDTKVKNLENTIFMKTLAGVCLIVIVAFNLCACSSVEVNKVDDIGIAIIDSGIDYNLFADKVFIWENYAEIENGIDDDENGYVDDVYGWNFVEEIPISNLTEQTNFGGHGTSICSALLTNIEDYSKVKVMSLKIYDDLEDGKIDDLIEAIKYAEKQGAKICNLSFYCKEYNAELYNTMKSSQMIFVVAAGNGNTLGVDIDNDLNGIYPANFDLDNIIVVASESSRGTISKFSNYGVKSVDLAAKGENIFIKEYNTYVNGTSFATSFVVAKLVEIMNKKTDLDVADIRIELLEKNCEKRENLYSYINEGRSLMI